jgi:hypothetical protein
MKSDVSAIAQDWLLWVSVPSTGICWLNILYPLWGGLPPILLILVAVLILAGLASGLSLVLPSSSPWYIWLYRGIQVSCGLLLALRGILA